jgi:3-polyprenyl-4-hydroxybenzoate decarboxylase
VLWALCFRMQPDKDIRITPAKSIAMDPSIAPPEDVRYATRALYGSAMMIDATMKWGYPPVSMPRREFMERAREIWEAEGLPPLTPKKPWHGYELGFWTDEDREEAEIALKGEHFKTGEKIAKSRIKG